MNYLSVCSGIEAASVAWKPLGWEPVAFSETAAFPSAVLQHHYPAVPNWGDMTKFKEWPNATVDLLIGGTPCQSFSVSGLRAGLDDPRGELMLTFGSLAKRYRPRWVVWENVPGVLSSNGGRDFGAFLGMLAECGYGFAYRVCDAQYWGLAQRRNRVFVVGYLGDWRPPAAVLFDSQALSGSTAKSRNEEEEITGTLPSRTTGGGGFGTDFECSNGVIPIVLASGQTNAEIGIDISPTITAAHDLPMVFQSKASVSQSMPFSDIAYNLDVAKSGGLAVVFVETFSGVWRESHISGPLRQGGSPELSAMTCLMDKSLPLAVRQLTPREWERLMGFPDDYTLIPYRKRMAADTPRYRAIGNSIAVPVLKWIGERIQMVEELR